MVGSYINELGVRLAVFPVDHGAGVGAVGFFCVRHRGD